MDASYKNIFDYNSEKWKKKRAAIMRRDQYQCQRCRRYGRIREAQIVHHIKHAEDYPELVYDNANLISLCESCHNILHPEKGSKAAKSHHAGRRYYK